MAVGKNSSLVVCLFVTLLGCNSGGQPEDWSKIDHIVLITVDTLRADHLGCYGYPGIQTPNLDGLAREGAFFKNAFVSMPRTGPSHTTILTGLYPVHHRVTNNARKVSGRLWPVSRIVKRAGFRTAGFVSSWILDARFGFDNGFDHFDDAQFDKKDSKGLTHEQRLTKLTRRGDATNAAAIKWMGENDRKRKDLVWLHYWDVHEPYDAPSKYRDMYLAGSKSLDKDYLNPAKLGSAAKPHGENRPPSAERRMRQYDGQITYFDMLLGKLIHYIKEHRPNTLVVLTADHGESFEHNEYQLHGGILYNSTLQVPLILWSPGLIKPHSYAHIVETADIVPTLVSRFGWKTTQAFDGSDLFKKRNASTTRAFATTRFAVEDHRLKHDWAIIEKNGDGIMKLLNRDSRSSTGRREKVLPSFQTELYDLHTDPAEITNRLNRNKKWAESLTRVYKSVILRTPSNREIKSDKSKLDAEQLKRLKALGYVD